MAVRKGPIQIPTPLSLPLLRCWTQRGPPADSPMRTSKSQTVGLPEPDIGQDIRFPKEKRYRRIDE